MTQLYLLRIPNRIAQLSPGFQGLEVFAGNELLERDAADVQLAPEVPC